MQVLASVFPYEEAAKLCGGSLPNYISKVSTAHLFTFICLYQMYIDNIIIQFTSPQELQTHFVSLDLLTSPLCDTPSDSQFLFQSCAQSLRKLVK
jgi:hypothetical protein